MIDMVLVPDAEYPHLTRTIISEGQDTFNDYPDFNDHDLDRFMKSYDSGEQYQHYTYLTAAARRILLFNYPIEV